jgi:RNA polymerase-binding transcription factor DksA
MATHFGKEGEYQAPALRGIPGAKRRRQAGSRPLDATEYASAEVDSDAEFERCMAELRAIGDALGRMVKGSYGICVACGNGIGAVALANSPTATRCPTCERDFRLLNLEFPGELV